jgi:biotin transporter BioY
MGSSPDSQAGQNLRPVELAPLPQLWIGYLLGFATIIAEFVAASLHPELAKSDFPIPPLYLFLVMFVGGVYWLVCVYRYHVVMQHIPGWTHPISPARAVGFHFIPIYNLYWVFKWPQEIARFVNWRFQQPIMKPQMVGLMVFAAFVMRFLFDPGFGLILLFLAASYVSGCLRRAFAHPSVPTSTSPPSAE